MLENFRSSGWSQTNVLFSIEFGDVMMNLHVIFTLPTPETN